MTISGGDRQPYSDCAVIMPSPISPGTLLHQRYKVLEVLSLGQGGWIYRATDTKRDRVVLEEWLLPQEGYSPDWQEYILAEFQPLLHLRDRPFPRYRVAFFEAQRLYFVRDEIAVEPYHNLLKQRLEQGTAFLEAEVQTFLQKVLPLLQGLHQAGVVHQNLTLESVGQQPNGELALVQFGLKSLQSFCLGGHCFAPIDQQHRNRVACDTDLYAVAAIAVVLLTGQPPNLLYDDATHRWTWVPLVEVSPQLAHVLDRMLSPNPPRRYATAAKVMQALSEDAETRPRGEGETIATILFLSVLVGLAAIGAWRIFFHMEQRYALPEPAAVTLPQPPTTPSIERELLSQLTNDVPASTLSERLALLSTDAQQGIGTYKRVNYTAILAIAKQQNMSPRSVEALTDAQFFAWFPQLQGKKLEPKTWGQVWYAIAQDLGTAIQTKALLRSLPPKTELKDSLNAGQGKLYLLEVKPGQTLRVQTGAEKPIRLSVFPPPDTAFPALNNSTETEWTGKAQRAGIYEIIVAPTTTETIRYSLKVSASN
jgi:serine/threonine-protein kinase